MALNEILVNILGILSVGSGVCVGAVATKIMLYPGKIAVPGVALVAAVTVVKVGDTDTELDAGIITSVLISGIYAFINPTPVWLAADTYT